VGITRLSRRTRTPASCLEQAFFHQKPISIDLAVVRGAWYVVRLIARFINVSRNAQRKTHNAPIMANLSFRLGEFARKRRLA